MNSNVALLLVVTCLPAFEFPGTLPVACSLDKPVHWNDVLA